MEKKKTVKMSLIPGQSAGPANARSKKQNAPGNPSPQTNTNPYDMLDDNPGRNKRQE